MSKPKPKPIRIAVGSNRKTEIGYGDEPYSASHIDIGIDCQEWECWVKDDGNGIPRSGLDALSKSYEAGRYSMSFLY
jgi:hypothetical protein